MVKLSDEFDEFIDNNNVMPAEDMVSPQTPENIEFSASGVF